MVIAIALVPVQESGIVMKHISVTINKRATVSNLISIILEIVFRLDMSL